MMEARYRQVAIDGCPIEVGLTDTEHAPTNYTNGCAVGAYIYPNVTDATMFDRILYADVETIFPNNGANSFSNIDNLEKIIFDCKFSMANAADKSMIHMFSSNHNLMEIEGLENIDTTNVTMMDFMFHDCGLVTLDVSHFNTSNVTSMCFMFADNNNLTTITGLESFNTSNVMDMRMMFDYCFSLTSLDLSNFDLSSIRILKKLGSSLEWPIVVSYIH